MPDATPFARSLMPCGPNIMGYFRSAQAVLPYLKQAGWGRIINISGMAARNAGTISGMRNLALVHFTKTLSMELGPHGINVNLIHPGTTYTERSRPLYEEQARQRGITVEEVEAEVAGATPFARSLMPARSRPWRRSCALPRH